MNLSTGPLEKWLHPDATWTKSDARAWLRARRSGRITEQTADRLCLRYAGLQVELIHPDLP